MTDQNSNPDIRSKVIQSPAERYANAISSGQFMPDDAQAEAVHQLNRVWEELILRYKASKKLFVVFAVKLHRKACICGVV